MLYGQLAWQLGSRVEPVPSGRAASVLVALAEQQPRWVSATSLVGDLWDPWPQSGLNALQRQISLLRSHLRQLDLDDQIVQTSSRGYRLDPWVSTDLVTIGKILDTGRLAPGDQEAQLGPHWWAEPLPGLSWDHHKTLRGTLAIKAGRVRKLWVANAISSGHTADAARLLGPMLVRNPYDTGLVHRRVTRGSIRWPTPGSIVTLTNHSMHWIRCETDSPST